MNRYHNDQDSSRDYESLEVYGDSLDPVSEWAVDCDEIGNPVFCEASIADSLRPACC